jgi:hypothetical protein
VIVSTELPGVVELIVTLLTLSVVDMFAGFDELCWRSTVPEKPPVLVTTIVVCVEVVAFMLIDEVMPPALDVRTKSGGGTMSVIVTEFVGRATLFPVIAMT